MCAAASLPPVVGLLANPRSGRDVRRLVASAGTSELTDKISIVRRLMLGAAAVGQVDWRVLPEPHGIVRRATEVRHDLVVSRLDIEPVWGEPDTTAGAARLAELGARVVVTLGGDGTNRAAALGWPDIPLIPLSTGTNNAFPVFVEPTVAGTVVGLIGLGVVDIEAVSRPAKIVHVDYADAGGATQHDMALVDALAVADRFVGSMDLFEPETMQTLVLTRAEVTAIGLASVGGRLHPLSNSDDGGLLVRFGPAETSPRRVLAPTAPGHHDWMGVEEVRPLERGERVTVEGPTILAFDGERKLELVGGQTAELWIDRDGPRVVDMEQAMSDAIGAGFFTCG